MTVFLSSKAGKPTILVPWKSTVSIADLDQNAPTLTMPTEVPSSELEHKIRLLTLATLAFKHVGQSLPYSKVAEALQVDLSEVEKWAIDGKPATDNVCQDWTNNHAISVIRAGLVWGKLSQTTQSLYITRATSRTFEEEQWGALEKRLIAWKSGLAGILDVVANAKRQGGQAVA